jgi:hypothetical protein
MIAGRSGSGRIWWHTPAPAMPRCTRSVDWHLWGGGWEWSEAKLATYIDDPRKTVPGTRMPFIGVHDAAKAQSIAAYLATLK